MFDSGAEPANASGEPPGTHDAEADFSDGYASSDSLPTMGDTAGDDADVGPDASDTTSDTASDTASDVQEPNSADPESPEAGETVP